MEIKKLLIIITIIANIGLIKAQYTAIPDTCFELILIANGIDSEGTEDGQVLTSDIANVVGLDLGYFGNCDVLDASGIEDFTNLEFLFIGHSITSIDLSNNLQLKEITALDGNLQDINITNCTELEVLWIIYNQLTYIDLSTNINLEYLYLSFNSLLNIDTLNNLNLLRFYCDNNQLTEVNINHLINLNDFGCSNNLITNLDINNLNQLTRIHANRNIISTINISNLKNIENIGISSNDLTEIDLSSLLNLEGINLNNNQLTEIDLSTLPNLERVRLQNNQLVFLDLRNNNNNNFSYFDIENNPNLNCVFVDNAQYSQSNWTHISSNSTFVETESECEALQINANVIENEFSFYPNPVKNILTIKTPNTTIKEIKIYTVLGKEIIKTTNKKIDLSYLSNDIYIVKITTSENNIITKKIVKNDN